MEAIVRTLSGLTAEHVTQLAAQGINNADDLVLSTFEDLRGAAETMTSQVARRLLAIGKYIGHGQELTATTTMPMINAYNNSMDRAPAAAAAAPAVVDPYRYAPKVSVNTIEHFSGELEDWEILSSIESC